MNRRDFLATLTAGAALAPIPVAADGSQVWTSRVPMRAGWETCRFRAYREGKTAAPVRLVTPEDGAYTHTFYDVCPFSPSGRYLAVTRFPYDRKKPVLGDEAEVCVIDLEEQRIRAVYRTAAWSFQLGANVQWGMSSDRYLYTNTVEEGRAHAVRIDLDDDSVEVFAGPKYDLAPDASYVLSGRLDVMNATQYGYAIPDPPGSGPLLLAPDDLDREGLWRTDLADNRRRLLVPFRRFLAAAEDPDYYAGGTFYCFHTKINRQGTRVFQVVRCLLPDGVGGRNPALFSFDPDGGHLLQCLSRERWNTRADEFGGAGNHPNWHPDGEHIVMNLVPKHLGYRNLRLCQFRYDGSDLRVLSENSLGSGHPSINADGTYLLVDAYPKESWVVGDDGEIPIRLIDLAVDREETVCTIAVDLGTPRNDPSLRASGGSHFKLDPHPAWDRMFRRICFNGQVGGRRQVLVADLEGML